jgi:hypothetical protein
MADTPQRPSARLSPSLLVWGPGATPTDKLTLTIASGIVVGYAGFLLLSFRLHLWILDAAGHPQVNDFVVFWVASHLALKGAALAAYDAHREHAAELATIGHPFHQLLGWAYPPLFLLVVMLPARLPYVAAFIAWGTVTLAMHAASVGAITGRRAAVLVACAMPWVLIEFILGQNGFLISAVIGMVLVTLEKRPILSGILLGFLSCKPQFGILFPLALAAGGYWRAFAAAALATLAWNGLAGVIFGPQSFMAFVHALSTAADSHLVRSDLGWNKLQSVYGLLRDVGASAGLAWSAQGVLVLVLALGIAVTWHRRDVPFALKAALLATATPLATPYVLYYDVPVLAIAGAFLFRHRGFDRFERVLMAATVPFLFLPFLPFLLVVPGALVASLVMATMVVRRLRALPRATVSVARTSPMENAGADCPLPVV